MLALPFGNPSTYPDHSGVDFAQRSGTGIRASGRGLVTFRGWLNERAGYAAIIDYDNGPPILYCHQPHVENVPQLRSRVDYGELIGIVGTTGRSTGPHLHMEVMDGAGAHTYAGIWRYFDRWAVVGQATPAGNPDPTPAPTKPKENDMGATKIISDGGVSLVIDGQLFWPEGMDQANAIQGAQEVRVSPVMHAQINARYATNNEVPMLVYVRDGDCTVYTYDNGRLVALADPATMHQLIAKGAGSLTLSAAEVANIRGQQ